MNTTTVFHCVLEPILGSLPPVAARQISQAQADEALPQRVEFLAHKTNEGELTGDEQREYQAYVNAGGIIATMQTVAQKLLRSAAG